MATEQDPPLKLYWVTMKIEANYSLLIPAISEDEAIILADEKPVPVAEITDLEKDVVNVAEMHPIDGGESVFVAASQA